MKKKMLTLLMTMILVGMLAGCGNAKEQTGAETESTESVSDTEVNTESVESVSDEEVTILVAAAASLENCYTQDLIPMFEEKYPNITVTGTYDSSGKLQTQIEEGLQADVFMSAATKQMNALKDENLINADSVVELLENKLVLIVPASAENISITGFEDIINVSMIAIGDPESVPAGQYAKEAFTNLGIWEEVYQKASLGTNVTEVLNWVAAASADAGVVYATDAASTQDVLVITEAPEGSLETPVIYPVGIVSSTAHEEAAKLFVDFLQSDEAMDVFEAYGFSDYGKKG